MTAEVAETIHPTVRAMYEKAATLIRGGLLGGDYSFGDGRVQRLRASGEEREAMFSEFASKGISVEDRRVDPAVFFGPHQIAAQVTNDKLERKLELVNLQTMQDEEQRAPAQTMARGPGMG